ncbi:MAG: UDP-N-acetylmuramoyl-L-alanyl-D-glutamate--2,6-diaminopimelate ligase [Candidatus Aminicenantales bacterium]
MTLKDLFKDVTVLAGLGDETVDIQGITYSSKAVKPNFLFAALKGEKRDGFDFVPEALKNGAAAVLSDKPKPSGLDVSWIQVFDPREALALCSANFYDNPSYKMKLVGITGTKGKTTITFILESILKIAGYRPGVIGTINYRGPDFELKAQRTTPEAPDLQNMLKTMFDTGVTHCLMEVSSHSLDLKRVSGISFDVAVFTNLSGEHLDYHHTMDEYFAAKKKLFMQNSKKRTAVVNEDDPWGKRLIAELPMNTITFGLEPAALVRSEKFKLNGPGLEALVKYPGGQATITSSLSGKHNLYNILAAFSVALALNVSPQVIRDGIAALKQVPGRFEKIENDFGLNIYVDYAHTDSALRSLLETVKELKPSRILLVFGAGGDRDKFKRERMGEIAGLFADWTFITSDNPRSEDPMDIIREIEKGVLKTGSKKYSLEIDRQEAIAKALAFAKKGDYVLFAGKGHESTQVIKDRVIPFNDGDVIREILAKMGTA